MNRKLKILITAIIAILVVLAVVAVISMNNRHKVVDDISEVKTQAQMIYEAGDTEGAINRMEVYCTYVYNDTEARATLGDWYMETGNGEKAYECYYIAAMNKGLVEERIPSLSVKNTEEIILAPVEDVVMEITPDVRVTKDMRLVITGHNLVPDEVYEGKITEYNRELSEEDTFYTTDWFSVDPEGKYLTMSGGFNCAIWQFKNADGEITHYAVSPNHYRVIGTYSVDVYQMARAAIPEKSVWCRVTYFDKSREAVTASPDEELTIVYGRLPGESYKAGYASYDIPDLKEGESIVYKNGKWNYVKDGQATELTDWIIPQIERGSYVMVSGSLPGRVSFARSRFADFSSEGIYTVRFDKLNPSAMGARLDDAKNLGFNSAVSRGTIALGENHFDSIYPWKDIKLCTIADGEVTSYEGDAGFSHDGSKGDVFVEIPKFYVRRVVDERYDALSISGVCHEGFEVDEAFIAPDGREVDKIYVAAYITSLDAEGRAISASDTNPVSSLSPEELSHKAKERGYSEIDYAALSALQKLFMVETGLRNSQYLYLGTCAYTMATKDGANADYPVALTSNAKTNCIVVDGKFEFEAGNSVILFDALNYDETIEEAYKNIRSVKTVIDNSDGSKSVYVSGEPMNIVIGRTAIAHTALPNGSARNVGGHTGAISTERGTVAFKYRNVENLWGNTYIYVDSVTVKDSEITLKKRTGETRTLSYKLPDAEDRELVDSMVRSVGYDIANPQVMLPDTVGNGATISTYYGDAFIDEQTDDGEYVLHYGGAWNSRACAGLFNFAVSSKKDEAYTNTSGRMMMVK
ncbi:MAG: hypothetical protein IKU60_01190 [Clostridia bacterium]|nr:hypothetical protein [Clostridia bacterium]